MPLKITKEGVIYIKPKPAAIGIAYVERPCNTCDDMVKVQRSLMAGPMRAFEQRIKNALRGKRQ